MRYQTIRILLLLAAVLVALTASAAPGVARNGSDDDDDIRGTVASFSNGVLTIRQSDGDEVSGKVTRRTEIECERGHRSRAAHDGNDDHGDDDDGHRGRHDDDRDRCGTRALKTGRLVREAELRTTSSGLVFREVEIVS